MPSRGFQSFFSELTQISPVFDTFGWKIFVVKYAILNIRFVITESKKQSTMFTFGRRSGIVPSEHKLASEHTILVGRVFRPVNVSVDGGEVVITKINGDAFRSVVSKRSQLLHERGDNRRRQIFVHALT